MMDVFPFIVGSPRSGTTLLRAMFDSHPEMAIPWESYFITQLAPSRYSYELPDGFAVDLFVEQVLKTAVRVWKLPEEELRAALADPPPADYPDAVRRVFAAYARWQGKRRYGDKTPRYAHHLPLLAELFPEARFIHIIRDGRNVALSMLKSLGWQSFERAVSEWKGHVEVARRDGAALGPRRYTEIRYEALLADPKGTLRALCAFVELPFDPAMLRYHERGETLIAMEPIPARHPHLVLPPTAGLRDWRLQMTLEELGYFESVTGALLQELGYETALICPFPVEG